MLKRLQTLFYIMFILMLCTFAFESSAAEQAVTLDSITYESENLSIMKDDIRPQIYVGNVSAKAGGSIDVPVYINGNTGVCGAVLSISYDDALQLTAVKQGSAWSQLAMTKPGDLSANPIRIIWDGMENDTSDGTIVILSFTLPQTYDEYNVSLSCEDGDIVDSNLKPLEIAMINGTVSSNASSITVEIGNKSLTINSDDTDGSIYVSFYDDSNQLKSLKRYLPQNDSIKLGADKQASYAKIMWFKSTLQPLCNVQKIQLNQE